MASWKNFLPKSANFGKYEKEEKQKYKQYVKVEAQNAQLRSKPESEVYEDFLLLRSKSSRRSSKKRKAPAPQNIDNAYEILDHRTLPSNVVVINDDLRNRFAGYEPPKLQENVYVVVQNYQDEDEKPRRLRWKKNLPAPPETNENPPPPPPPIGDAQRVKPSKSKQNLQVREDDTHPSISEVYFDCEDFLEIPSTVETEDPKSRKSDKANLITAGTFDVTDGHPNAAQTDSTRTNHIYDEPSEASLPQSYDVEYEYIIEDEGYFENQKVHNHYSNEPEDESMWQPSNVRFLEMSGDEEEQQIYGPYGTFEVTNYENTLNNRIQMVLESERHSVMRSLEEQRNEEARNNVEETEEEMMFEVMGPGTYLDANQDDFGIVDFEGYDEEFSLAQAKNVILIEALEEETERRKHDSSLNKSTDRFKFPEEIHPSPDQFSSGVSDFTAKPIPLDLRDKIREDPDRNEDSSSHKHSIATRPFDFTAKNTERHLNEPTTSNIYEEIQEDREGASNVVEPIPSNLQEEIREEPKRYEGGSLFKHSKNVDELTPSNLHEEMHEEPQEAKNVDLDLKKTPPSTLREGEFHQKNDNAIAESNAAENIAMWLKEILPSLENRDIPQAEAEMRKTPHLHEKEEESRIMQKETSPPLEQREIPQAEAETKEDSQPPSLNIFDKYSAFLKNPTLTMDPRSKTEQNNQEKENDEEFNEDLDYENLQFDLSTKAKEESPLRSKKLLQNTPGHQKKPVAQPRLSLFDLKPSRNNYRSTRSSSEPENSQLDGQHAISDLFNGLPVESEDLERNSRRVILKEQNKENSRESKTRTTGPFNELPVRSRADVNSGISQNGNLKIPWETKPRTSSIDDDAAISSSNLKEEESQSKFLKIPWRTSPKAYPNDEKIFANSSSSKQEEGQNEILKIPWETKPKRSPIDRNNFTFFSNSETIEKDLTHPRKLFGQAQKNPIYDTSHELFNPHDVQPSPNITDENEKDRGNFKVFWETTPAFFGEKVENPETKHKMFEQNKTGSGDVTNPNFDGDGVISREFNGDSLEEKSDKPDKLGRTDPGFDENIQNVNDKDVIHETFAPLNKSDKIWTESKELGDNASIPQDHGLWTSNSIDEAEGQCIETNLNDAPQYQTVNPSKEDEIEKDDKLQTQNEANILEENYRILRGFNVVKEEGVIYQNIEEISSPDPVPPQLPIDKTKITKKVSFKISEVDENLNKYVPAHSPTEENGHIKKSPKLEAITRKLEKQPSLQHSMSLTEPEKPKPNFTTFPRVAGRNQSSSKSGDLERIQQVLSGISDLTSVNEQVSAMEDVFNKVKKIMDRLEKSEFEDEYSELLHIMFRSVRIATVLECGFDPVLLDRQQTLLDNIKNSIATSNTK